MSSYDRKTLGLESLRIGFFPQNCKNAKTCGCKMHTLAIQNLTLQLPRRLGTICEAHDVSWTFSFMKMQEHHDLPQPFVEILI